MLPACPGVGRVGPSELGHEGCIGVCLCEVGFCTVRRAHELCFVRGHPRAELPRPGHEAEEVELEPEGVEEPLDPQPPGTWGGSWAREGGVWAALTGRLCCLSGEAGTEHRALVSGLLA